MKLNRLMVTVLACGLATPALAQLNEPIPETNYITFGGFDWAWASPCPPSGSFDGTTCGNGAPVDFSYQSTLGWRLATAADLLTGPSQDDFLDANGAVICASAWFTSAYTHCDYGNPVYGSPDGNVWYAETWAIRDASGAVPEPAAWGMMIGGFALAGAALRRRSMRVSYAA